MTIPEEPVGLFELVARESVRAEAKFGNQLNVPSLDKDYMSWAVPSPASIADHYEIPSELRAKFLTNRATEKNELTWAHIAVEELAEVIGCMGDEKAMREELIQLMSVCQRWIQSIEHRNPSLPKYSV